MVLIALSAGAALMVGGGLIWRSRARARRHRAALDAYADRMVQVAALRAERSSIDGPADAERKR